MVSRSAVAILSSAEAEKKKKYNNAANARRASFTPFVVSVDGALGREATSLPEISDARDVFLTRHCKRPLIFRARVH